MNSPATHPRPDDIARLLRDDGDAPPDLAGHLADCPDCRDRLERQAMGDTDWLLDAARATAIPTPPELIATLRGFHSPLTGETLARLETLPDATVEDLLPNPAGQRQRVGPYEVLGVVGRGGMGIVLQGHDVVLHRTVALKIPTLAMRGDVVARGRFLREGRAAASITHPNVVPVLAVEEYAGVPVLVMPFVQGESLQQRLDREKTVPPAEALRIALETVLALGAAHERGLVHRDVKPANILLESPSDHVRLTDFGLARAADDARLTQTGLGAGTPLFMSPEQARGEAVDARTDLFALGSVLFVMVTGKAPFAMSTLMGTLRRLADGSPDSPRLLAPNLPRHVEELIMDLLKNSPADRPADAVRVADRLRDCLRYLAEGIEPRRQRRRVLTLAGLFFAATLATAGTVLKFPTPEGTLVVEIDDPEATVIVDRDGSEMTVSGVGLKEVKLKLGQQKVKIQGRGQTREEVVSITRDGKPVLKATLVPADSSPDATTAREGAFDAYVRLFLGQPPVKKAPAGPKWAIFEDRFFYPQQDFDIKIPGNGQPGQPPLKVEWTLRPLMATEGPVRSVVVSPDGRRVLSASGLPKADGTVRVWDPESGKLLRTLRESKEEVACLAYSRDGKAVFTGSQDGVIRVWDDTTGRELMRFDAHKGPILAVAVSPDGKLLASSGEDLRIQVRDLRTDKVVRTFATDKIRTRSLAFSPDSARLLCGGDDEILFLCDLESGKLLWTRKLDNGSVDKVAFMPDGRGFFACSKKTFFGDPATGETILELRSHPATVTDLAFSPDGKLFATCDIDGQVVLCSTNPVRKLGQERVIQGTASSLAFSPDGRSLYVGGGGRLGTAQRFTFHDDQLGVRRADIIWGKADAPAKTPDPMAPKEILIQPRR